MESKSVSEIFEKSDPFGSWWPFIIATIVGIAMTIRTLMGGQRCPNTNLIDKQIVIITGGNSGIGLEICKALVKRSAHIIIACKDLNKANKAIEMIKNEFNRSSSYQKECMIESKYLDLQSFDNVRRFAKDFIRNYDRLDILINNAGIIFHPNNEDTVDGYEIHLQVNYLSHFLLTHLLIDHLKKSKNGRIINISAHAHAAAKISSDDPLNVGVWKRILHPREAFSHSKLAIVLSTRHMAKLLKGTNVTINACTPGLVRGTNHLRRSPLMKGLCIKIITFPWMWLFMKTATEGAQCPIYLATEPKLKDISGEYFNDCEIVSPSELAKDDKLAEKLYTETIRVLNLPSIQDINDDILKKIMK